VGGCCWLRRRLQAPAVQWSLLLLLLLLLLMLPPL
jgi:hypothetical protein